MVFEELLKAYLMSVNIFSFLVFGLDKVSAIIGIRRISERHLHMLTLSGGCVGSITGMSIFRHKTKKPQFIMITLIISMVEIAVIYNYLSN
jgi:uncharacterized membrane protein YsdA (DUF1294 family)